MIIHLSESLSDHTKIETSHKDWQLIYRQLCFIDPSLKQKLSKDNCRLEERNRILEKTIAKTINHFNLIDERLIQLEDFITQNNKGY